MKCAKLVAILFGLRYCVQLGIDIAQIFSDSFSAVKGVIQDVEDCGPEGIFIMEIRDLITFHGATTFHHMRRQANEAAHQLARHDSKFSICF